MPITDLSDLVNRATGGNDGTPTTLWFQKVARIGGAAATAPIAGRWASLWRYDGVCWPGGAVPTTVAAPTAATTGALVPWANAGGTRDKHLIQAWATGLVAGTLLVYDRLLHVGGLSGTNTAAQAVGGALTRHTDGVGVFAFAEVHTQIGASASAITLSEYTNQAGAGSRAGPAVVIGGTGFREVTRAIMLPLQAGDTGLRAVTSVDLTVTTGTAGDFGVTLGFPLCFVSIDQAGGCGWRDFSVGLPGIPILAGVDGDDVCLAALWQPATTTAPELLGALSFVEK